MDLRLLISLALFSVWSAEAGPRDRGRGPGTRDLQEAISQLQLLKDLTASNQLGDDWSASPKAAKISLKPKSESDSDQSYGIMHVSDPIERLPPPSPVAVPAPRAPPPAAHTLYSDGPFSDIPSDAFQLEHRKEFRLPDPNRGGGGVTKKDLNGHAHTQANRQAPESLMRTCLNFFRGRSAPQRSSLELVLGLCTELVDGRGGGEFSLDDDKRQRLYDLRADGRASHHHPSLGPAAAAERELCPRGHHVVKATALEHNGHDDDDYDRDDDDDDDREDVRSEVLLSDLLELFKPIGSRREWMVINSKNPDKRMRTYVDLKK